MAVLARVKLPLPATLPLSSNPPALASLQPVAPDE